MLDEVQVHEQARMLKSIRNVDYVVLLCNDLPAMRHFYHHIMAFPIYLET
jgi:hypothetical protein